MKEKVRFLDIFLALLFFVLGFVSAACLVGYDNYRFALFFYSLIMISVATILLFCLRWGKPPEKVKKDIIMAVIISMGSGIGILSYLWFGFNLGKC